MTLVFLLDVDNTLLNNDRLKEDLADRIQEEIGPERAERFWQVYEEVRSEQDYVDFPTTVRRIQREYTDDDLGEKLTHLINTVSFAGYLYPHVLETLQYLKTLGTPVILSDGDSVFQPLKIRESGLEAAVDGNVMVYVHKEHELNHVFERFPADHYVVVDDKPRIISALEKECPGTFTTILVLQGKYARRDEFEPKPDYVIERIADLRTFSRAQFAQPVESHTGSS